jgi:hypothetical protein
MPPKPSTLLYIKGEALRAAEATPVVLPKDLVQPESSCPIRPLGREVLEAELQDWLQQIANVNQWFALTYRNIDLVTKVFLFDERLSPQHTMEDLVNAVKIADAEHRLDKNAPPPPPARPTFTDDDPMEPLMDGTMPLPIDATPYEQRRATIAQQRNLVARLRKFEVWQREQQQSGISFSSN